MTKTHLTDDALEALAHDPTAGRVSEADRAHAIECAECTAAIEDARALSLALGTALREAPIPEVDLDALVRTALAKAEEPQRASRRSLVVAGAVAALVAAALGVLSLRVPSVGDVVGLVGDTTAVFAVLLRVVRLLVPGGTATVGLVGVALVLLLAWPMRRLLGGKPMRESTGLVTLALGVLLVILVAATGARAQELRGEWPARDPAVTVNVRQRPVSEALGQVTRSAGLGLVIALPEDPTVTVQLTRVPLRDALRAILAGMPVDVVRTGQVIAIRPATGGATPAPAQLAPGPNAGAGSDVPAGPPANVDAGLGAAPPIEPPPALPPPPPIPPVAVVPPVPPVPPMPPVPRSHGDRVGQDRITFGDDVVVAAGEHVRDVVTFGGDVTIEGVVERDCITMGGDVRIREGGVVHGDVRTMGGEVTVEEGGLALGQRIDVGAHGQDGRGAPHGPSSIVSIVQQGGDGHILPEFVTDAMRSASSYALLFLLGLLLVGVSPGRLSAMQASMVREPVRAFASGVLGVIATTVLTLVLGITFIGIPIAVLLVLVACLAAYVGLAAAASVIGGAMPVAALRDRPVLQLAAGVLALFLASFVPVLGVIVTIIALLFGLGAVLVTRMGARRPIDRTQTAAA